MEDRRDESYTLNRGKIPYVNVSNEVKATGKMIELGKIVMTRGVRTYVNPYDVSKALDRHQALDFGDISENDKEVNLEAVKSKGQILSSYEDRIGMRFWIITEHDRSATTILLPSEY